MASGHVNRTNRPNTWLHRPAKRREDFPCQLGAVHTWHLADLQGPSSDVLMTIAVISRVAVLSVRSSGGEVLHPSRELRRLEVSALVRSAGCMRVRQIR